jgi:gamma-tubulin complex component 5
LVEKFAVLNRDDLSEALDDRLQELSKVSSRWTPEILSLFLQLADRPATNSRIENLASLNAPEPITQVTWQEIVEDDPLNETGVWDDIDYGAESDEASFLDPTLEPSHLVEETEALSEDLTSPRSEEKLQAADQQSLKSLKESQYWNRRDWDRSDISELPDQFRGLSLITELQTIREVLFMLHGLPTSLFNTIGPAKIISVNETYRLGHVELETFRQVLKRFGELGTTLNRIRWWTSQDQTVSLIQAFQASVRDRLGDLNSSLATIESRYVDRKHNVSVSLIEVYNELLPLSRRLSLLGGLLDQLIEGEGREETPPFRCLLEPSSWR